MPGRQNSHISGINPYHVIEAYVINLREFSGQILHWDEDSNEFQEDSSFVDEICFQGFDFEATFGSFGLLDFQEATDKKNMRRGRPSNWQPLLQTGSLRWPSHQFSLIFQRLVFIKITPKNWDMD